MDKFERWLKLSKKEENEKADRCCLIAGSEVQNMLRLIPEGMLFDKLKKDLIEELEDIKPHEAASRHLVTLKMGELSCRKLARQDKHLSQIAF